MCKNISSYDHAICSCHKSIHKCKGKIPMGADSLQRTWSPLHPPMLQSIVSSRAGQAAPPNCGCWTTSLVRVFLPPLQVALQSLQSVQPPTSQSTRQNTFNALPPTVYQNLVKMVIMIMMNICLYIRIF